MLGKPIPNNVLIRIVDDDEELLKNMVFFLQMVGFEVQSFNSAQSFLENNPEGRPGCAILDHRMPGMTGMELQEELQSRGSVLPIIFLSAHGDIPMAMRAVKKGAVDFLVKPPQPDELLDAIHRAVETSIKVQKQVHLEVHGQEKVELLTPRELDVAKCVARGLLNKQIADELGLALATVKMHRGNVTRKLGVHSSVAIAQMLVKANVLSAEEVADR